MPARVDPIVPYRIAKPSGGERVMARLTAHDAARWEGLAVRLAPAIEARLSDAVLANRARPVQGSVRFQPLGATLMSARRAARKLALSSAMLLRTDVAAFYPSITPSVLARTMGDRSGARPDAFQAADMLDGWGSEGYSGLPIGPEGSAVLANAILTPVDSELRGVRFLRWVDDYLLAVRSERHAKEVVERIDHTLGRLSLRRSVSKTVLIDAGRSLRWPGTLSGV